MSKLSDYSKFDHLDDDDDSEDEQQELKKQESTSYPSSSSAGVARSTATTSTNTATTSTTNTATSQESVSGPRHVRLGGKHGGDDDNGLDNPGTTSTGSINTNIGNGRFAFYYNNNKIYEWEQSLDDVTIYVTPPPFVTQGQHIICQILPTQLKLGLKMMMVSSSSTTTTPTQQSQQKWYLNEETGGLVDASESMWSLEDDDNDNRKVIVIYLTKAHRGSLWDTALKGRQELNTTSGTTTSTSTAARLDPIEQEQVRQKLMLERFQEENPGFDFRDATFNGSVPDPRTFMGGVKYK